ncbi:M48 family metalloprotease [Arenicella xantha]|uniref:Putative Zn-dependent protease n=1 Tax=Arenicella xantha TaxID=644221 RepID=A0A395JMC7_9GAMM|nr:M48 family metalloprotease [Arenicella xantha]RBP48940.1 putative Zn-dependent protease [Arenicella xantha]
MSRTTVARCVVSIGLSLFLIGCATDPVTGRPTLARSESWEIQQGARYHQEILKQYQVYDDPELQAYVNDVGQKLAAKSHRSHLKFTFTVLDSPEVNAFALPGGYVYVTRGIMAYMTKESHLAGVIGHEIGHVSGLHGAERAAQQPLVTGATLVVGVATGSGDLMQASQMLGGALLSGYGRTQELESDGLGAEYIAQNNYNPEDMIDVIGILKNQELFARQKAADEGVAYQGYHGLFSTHPRNDQRLQGVIKAAEKYRDLSKPEPDDGEFLRLTDGLAYGQSESQGIVHGNKFYHKALDLFVEFPDGWQVINGQTALGAVSPDRSQVVQMHMDSIAPPVDASGYLSTKFTEFRNGQSVATSEDQALAGVVTVTDASTGQRTNQLVSMVTRGTQAFVIAAAGKTQLPDQAFLSVTKSVRRLKSSEMSLAEGRSIKVVTAQRGDTIASLAAQSNLDKYQQEQIRLINNLYPDGEPRPGQRIKVVK